MAIAFEAESSTVGALVVKVMNQGQVAQDQDPEQDTQQHSDTPAARRSVIAIELQVSRHHRGPAHCRHRPNRRTSCSVISNCRVRRA